MLCRTRVASFAWPATLLHAARARLQTLTHSADIIVFPLPSTTSGGDDQGGRARCARCAHLYARLCALSALRGAQPQHGMAPRCPEMIPYNGAHHLQPNMPANQAARAALLAMRQPGCDWLHLKPKQTEPNSQADLESSWQMEASLACFFPGQPLLSSRRSPSPATHSAQQPPIPNLASESYSGALHKQRHPTEHESTTAHHCTLMKCAHSCNHLSPWSPCSLACSPTPTLSSHVCHVGLFGCLAISYVCKQRHVNRQLPADQLVVKQSGSTYSCAAAWLLLLLFSAASLRLALSAAALAAGARPPVACSSSASNRSSCACTRSE